MFKTELIGRVATAPVTKTVKVNDVDTQVTNFRVAINSIKRDRPAIFIEVTCWRGLSDLAEKYAKVGRCVYLEGNMSATTNVTSDKVYTNLHLSVANLEFCDGNPDNKKGEEA